MSIIVVGLAGRAALDKILALHGGSALVGLWAQLQSIADLVSGMVLAGIGNGLTATVAQARNERRRRELLKTAFRYGLPMSFLAMAAMALLPGTARGWLVGNALSPGMVALGAIAGWIAVSTGLLSAYWLGKQQRLLVLALVTATMLPLVAWAVGSGELLSPKSLLLIQCACGGIIASFGMLLLVRTPVRGQEPGLQAELLQDERRLLRYLPAGIAIGILSPLSLVLARGIVAHSLSWHDAGLMQAVWRSSEWITGLAAGILSVYFFPRMSRLHGSLQFGTELRNALACTLLPAALLLYLLYCNQKPVLAFLYDEQFALSDRTAGFFFLGDWVRIGSWVFLYAMFAMRRTWLIVLGELLSLPLFTALLQFAGYKLDLERVGLAYLTTYICYFVFNWLATMGGSSRAEPGHPRPLPTPRRSIEK